MRTIPETEYMPYGMYTCANGRQVLFRRKYAPLWERPGVAVPATAADPKECIPHVKQGWFLPQGSAWNLQAPHSKKDQRYLAKVVEDFKAGRPVQVHH